MRIGLLTQYPDNGSSSRLIQAAEAAGHDIFAINYLRCNITMRTGQPRVFYDGFPLPAFDAIIPRISASATYHGTSVVRHFELQGVYAPNGAQGISRSRDKLRSLQIMAGLGINTPRTAFGHQTGDVSALIDAVGGAPLIVKILEGTQGIGVVLCESRNSAQSTIEGFRSLGANILVQEFIKEASGEDLRCFVVGDKVVGAMVRRAAPGEFRANLHRGGTAVVARLTDQESRLAVAAAKAMNLEIAGVDLLRGKDGAMVIEVNSSPGLQGIEAATRKDVAGMIIRHVAKRAQEFQSAGSNQHAVHEDRIEG